MLAAVGRLLLPRADLDLVLVGEHDVVAECGGPERREGRRITAVDHDLGEPQSQRIYSPIRSTVPSNPGRSAVGTA